MPNPNHTQVAPETQAYDLTLTIPSWIIQRIQKGEDTACHALYGWVITELNLREQEANHD
jgi:hypothetical protein